MKKLIIQRIYFTDFDPTVQQPRSPNAFFEELRVDVTEADRPGIRNFVIWVATPEGIRDAMHGENWQYLLRRNLLILPKYDWKIIQGIVNDLLPEMEQHADEVT